MKLDKISERVYADVESRMGGNVGIIVLDDGVAAVDAQYPVSGAEFRQNIPKVTAKPVTHLLLTHCHGDHVFGAQAFEDCEIVAHRLLRETMERNAATVWTPGNLERMVEEVKKNRPERAWLYTGLKIVLPTQTFDTHYTLDGIKMIHTGGHTAGSSVVYVTDNQLLFAGDLVFAKTFPWGGDSTANPDAWIQAFKTILQMDIITIIPGHGPLCDKLEVKVQLDWFEAVRDEMKRLIAEGVSIEEAVKHDGYPDFYEAERKERRDNTLKHWYRLWSLQSQEPHS